MTDRVVDGRKIPYVIVDKPVLEDVDLSPYAKLVYVILCCFANNDTQQCFPGQGAIAKMAGISKPTTIKAIKSLTEKGYVRVDNRYDEKNGTLRLTNLYTILGSKGDCLGSKRGLLGVVNDVYQGSKPGLQELHLYNYTNKTNNALTEEMDKQFDELWSLYPRKRGKADARKKYPKLLKKYTHEQLIQAVNAYIKEIQEKGIQEQYIMYGSTFFNGGFVDYLDKPVDKPVDKPRRETQELWYDPSMSEEEFNAFIEQKKKERDMLGGE